MQFANRSFWTKVLLILLVLAIAVPGLNAYFGRSDAEVVATVGGEKIYSKDYNRAYEEEVLYLQNVLQISLTKEQMDRLGLRKAVLNKLIERKLVDNWVASFALDVGEASVMQAIRSIKVFHLEDGKFDEDKFNAFLQQMGMNQRGFYRMVKQDILREMLLKPFFAYGASHDRVAKDIDHYLFQRRKVDVVTFSQDMIKKIPKPSNEALQKIYQENQESFYFPEQREVSYVQLDKNNLKSEVVVSQDELNSALSALLLSQKAIFRYKSFESLEKANIYLERSDAAKLAADWSFAGENFDDFYEELWPMFEAMKAGKLTQAIALDGTIYVFCLEGKWGDSSAAMQSRLEQFTQGIYFSKLKDTLRAVADSIEGELSAQGASKEEVYKKYGVEVQPMGLTSFEAFPASFKPFASLVFDTGEGYDTGFLEDQEALINFRVDRVIPAAPKPFAQVVGKVREMWINQYSLAALKSMAETLVSDWRTKGAAKVVLAGLKLFRDELWRNRVAASENPKQHYPPDFVDKIFALKEGEISDAVEMPDRSIIVGIVRGIVDADENPMRISDANSNIRDVIWEAVNHDLKNYLASKFAVKINAST